MSHGDGEGGGEGEGEGEGALHSPYHRRSNGLTFFRPIMVKLKVR